MANTLGYYNPLFYANEALIALEKSLGMASRVYRGYEEERRSYERGEYINIRRPSVFTAADAPATAADINVGSVQIQLAYWREVKFKLTDKELAFTTEKIINDHIRPAAYALADDVDTKLVNLYVDVPWKIDVTGTATQADVVAARKVMRDNAVPLSDAPNMAFMLDSDFEADLLKDATFGTAHGGGAAAEATQRSGFVANRFGFEFFANQNVPTHTSNSLADASGTVVGAHSAGATTLAVTAFTASAVVKAGEIVTITGVTQQFVVTAQITLGASGDGTLAISPALPSAVSNGTVVTITLTGSSGKKQSMAFHRNAFALVMAPLPEMGRELGAQVRTVTDPVTGLSIRSRVYYVGNSSEVHVALDILYGVKTLDGNLAVRCLN